MTSARLARWGGLALVLAGCAATPPQPKHWTPNLPPELRESCRKAPADCRAAAEELARDWSTDEQAFGALKAFAAACEAGDAPACQAVYARFGSPRYLGSTPVPQLPAAVLVERPNGEWK